MSNLVAALVRSERIRTTDAKAKELRRLAERTITWGTSLGDLLTREPDSLSPEERARVVHHMRMARRVLKEPEALAKLFRDIAPRYLGRPGGYTRVLKMGQRPGDAAPMSLIELIPGGAKPAPAETEKPEKGKEKGGGAKQAKAKGEEAQPKVKAKRSRSPNAKKAADDGKPEE
jgi:large subunit ribosomal protein L17